MDKYRQKMAAKLHKMAEEANRLHDEADGHDDVTYTAMVLAFWWSDLTEFEGSAGDYCRTCDKDLEGEKAINSLNDRIDLYCSWEHVLEIF